MPPRREKSHYQAHMMLVRLPHSLLRYATGAIAVMLVVAVLVCRTADNDAGRKELLRMDDYDKAMAKTMLQSKLVNPPHDRTAAKEQIVNDASTVVIGKGQDSGAGLTLGLNLLPKNDNRSHSMRALQADNITGVDDNNDTNTTDTAGSPKNDTRVDGHKEQHQQEGEQQEELEEVLSFVAMADIPYKPQDRACLEAQIELGLLPPDSNTSTNATGQARLPPLFAIHLGDIKSGKMPCPERAYSQIGNLLGASPVDFFAIPGDNEWTDCDDQDQAWEYWVRHFGANSTLGRFSPPSSSIVGGMPLLPPPDVAWRSSVDPHLENFAFFVETNRDVNVGGGGDDGDGVDGVRSNDTDAPHQGSSPALNSDGEKSESGSTTGTGTKTESEIEGVGFVGLNLVGGPPTSDNVERLAANELWIRQSVQSFQSQGRSLKALVLFGHAQVFKPEDEYSINPEMVQFGKRIESWLNHDVAGDGLRKGNESYASGDNLFDTPVLYLHASGHDFDRTHHSEVTGGNNLTSIMVDEGIIAPPLLLFVVRNSSSGEYSFQFDRRGGLYDDSTGGMGCLEFYDRGGVGAVSERQGP